MINREMKRAVEERRRPRIKTNLRHKTGIWRCPYGTESQCVEAYKQKLSPPAFRICEYEGIIWGIVEESKIESEDYSDEECSYMDLADEIHEQNGENLGCEEETKRVG